MENNNQPVAGQLWVVIHIDQSVKFIASCTRGYMGNYPLFILTPLPAHRHHPEPMRPLLQTLAQALIHSLPTHRIYSVFAAEVVSQTFAAIWFEQTGINVEPAPYYHAKLSFATPQSVERCERPIAPIPGAHCELRPATLADVQAVAEMCSKFAETSVSASTHVHVVGNIVTDVVYIFLATIYLELGRCISRSSNPHNRETSMGLHCQLPWWKNGHRFDRSLHPQHQCGRNYNQSIFNLLATVSMSSWRVFFRSSQIATTGASGVQKNWSDEFANSESDDLHYLITIVYMTFF